MEWKPLGTPGMLNLVNELDKESQEMQREAAGGNVENHASKAA